ncbi:MULTISPECIES: type II secretion system protein [Rhodanobacteraceae]|uniref:type IV pilus modification PilV family protein n=1 Tax=Rhodanobacteraceae TaxID=1775411 RepID=UPI0009A6B889|nr:MULTISPECIES: type II secretion system protein [Rhodanobacteraceae]
MKDSCRGASLIESLVALAVFAIGSAATGTWFSTSIEADAKASRLMAAVSAIADLRERMHANPAGVASGHYHGVTARRSPGCGNGCAPAELAMDDLDRFDRTLHEQLGPPARHMLHCMDRSVCVVRISWDGRPLVAMSFKP